MFADPRAGLVRRRAPRLVLTLALVGVAVLAGEVTGASAEGPPQPLFDGRGFAGWQTPTGSWRIVSSAALDAADPQRLQTKEGHGVLVNGTGAGPGTTNLVTSAEYGDVELHVEFLIPQGSNSGVYLMGRYEVQILDSFGRERDAYPGIECGGLYPRWIAERNVGGRSPAVNASRPPGEWQSYDITFRAPRFDASGKKTSNATFVRVVHNGRVIHENVEVDGPTRASMADDERATGPVLLQGDHGPVAYRNLSVRPLQRD